MGNFQICIAQLNSEYFSICQHWLNVLVLKRSCTISPILAVTIYYICLCVFEGLCWFWWEWCWTGKRYMSSILISHSLTLSCSVSHFRWGFFFWVQHVFGDNRPSMETFEPPGSGVCKSQRPLGVAALICFLVTLSVCCTDFATAVLMLDTDWRIYIKWLVVALSIKVRHNKKKH